MREDKAEFYRMLANIVPLARTPMDKKGGQNLNKYNKSLNKVIDSFAPWLSSRDHLQSLRGKVKPGEVLVILDGDDDPNNPLFAGATISREK